VKFIPFHADYISAYIRQLRRERKHSGMREFVETLNFCEHVVGIDVDRGFENPWTKGILREAAIARKTLKQSRPLTMREVLILERFLHNELEDTVDRYGAGCMLFLLYARNRVSDVRNIDCFVTDFPDDESRDGYLEAVTQDHKNMRITISVGIPLHLVAPIYGLHMFSWGRKFVEVCNKLGLHIGESFSGKLFCAPDSTGSLVDRPATTPEVTKWLNHILAREETVPPGLTSHGLKTTLLSWCAKAGMTEEDRHILGHHSMRGKTSMVIYSRDIQAAPLRRLQANIADVRHGNFYPDATRSGMYRREGDEPLDTETSFGFSKFFTEGPFGGNAGFEPLGRSSDVPTAKCIDLTANQQPVKSERAETISETGSWSHVETGDTGTEFCPPEPISPPPAEAAVHEPASDSDSSSTDSSSSSDSEPEHDKVVERLVDVAVPTRKFLWKDHCEVYQNRKTKVLHLKLHLKPLGSDRQVFVCGRKLGDDFDVFTNYIYSTHWKCKQCDSWKPVRDAGSAAALLEALAKRPRSQ
jgi:hypothetical protein